MQLYSECNCKIRIGGERARYRTIWTVVETVGGEQRRLFKQNILLENQGPT